MGLWDQKENIQHLGRIYIYLRSLLKLKWITVCTGSHWQKQISSNKLNSWHMMFWTAFCFLFHHKFLVLATRIFTETVFSWYRLEPLLIKKVWIPNTTKYFLNILWKHITAVHIAQSAAGFASVLVYILLLLLQFMNIIIERKTKLLEMTSPCSLSSMKSVLYDAHHFKVKSCPLLWSTVQEKGLHNLKCLLKKTTKKKYIRCKIQMWLHNYFKE